MFPKQQDALASLKYAASIVRPNEVTKNAISASSFALWYYSQTFLGRC